MKPKKNEVYYDVRFDELMVLDRVFKSGLITLATDHGCCFITLSTLLIDFVKVGEL
jgi:hypothetical protein